MCVPPRSTQAGPAPAGPSSALSKCHSELVDYSGATDPDAPAASRLDRLPRCRSAIATSGFTSRRHVSAAHRERGPVAAVANEQWPIDGEEASYSVCNSSPGSSGSLRFRKTQVGY